jgi:uncharacterized delta-60 repeat protein
MRRTAVSVAMCLGLLALATPAQAAAGDLDATFNPTGALPGTVRTDFTPKSDGAIGMAIQSNGDIVAVGSAGAPDSAFAVARYLPDGTLDPSFGGGDGKVTTNISAFQDAAISVAIQGNGDIVVAGGVGLDGKDAKFGVVRYLGTNGNLDTTFGTAGTGIVVTNVVKKRFDEPTGVALQLDGKIVLAGSVGGGGNTDFGVVRYTTNGTLDSTFGSGGVVRTDFSGNSYDVGQGGLVIQPGDQHIVVGGYSVPNGSSNPLMAMARYNTDGTLDPTFSGDGKFTIDIGSHWDFVSWMALQADGKIVGAGEAAADGANPKAALIRVTAAGAPDTTFDGDGKLTTDLSPYEDFAAGVAIDSVSGDIVTGGGVGFGGSNPKIAVARYDPADGSLDTTFGAAGTGVVRTDLGPSFDYASFVAIDAAHNIVIAGESGGGGGNNKFALARSKSA